MTDPRYWMQTFTGRPFRYDAPENLDIGIGDIIRPLCRIPRFFGHSSTTIFVAEHSLCVQRLVRLKGGSPLVQMHALLHDAHEAFLGDWVSPLKRFIKDKYGFDYNELAAVVQMNITAALGIPLLSELQDVELIAECDLDQLRAERVLLMGSRLQWVTDTEPPSDNAQMGILRMSSQECFEHFTKNYHSLMDDLNAPGAISPRS